MERTARSPRFPWGLRFRLATVPEVPEGSITLEFTPAGANRWRPKLTYSGGEPLRLDAAELAAELGDPTADGWVFVHGRYMQMDCLVYRFGEPPDEGYDGRFRRQEGAEVSIVSREQAVVHLPARATPELLVASFEPDRYHCDIILRCDGAERTVRGLAVRFLLEGEELAPGDALELPVLWVAAGDDGWELLEEYAEALGRARGARVPARPPTGWCSWYYFYGEPSEAAVLANLRHAREVRLPLEVIQIDDGYQAATGDWLETNERFPAGMAALAEWIREAGFRPGLWLAPLVVHERSRTFRERPDILLHRKDGSPWIVETWLGRCGVLDCTSPAAQEWLRHLVEVVVHQWGYRYLKLDALAFAVVQRTEVRYADPTATGLQNLRRGLETIRSAAGEDVYLLGCTCHFGPAIGLVDGMRVGPDVKERWADGPNPSVRHAVRLALLRGWMHGRWWANDPDCVLLRQERTELNEEEVRFLVAAVAASGGAVFSGDHLPELSSARLQLLRLLAPPTGHAARPADLGDAPFPRVWRARLDEERSLLAVLNWREEPIWVVPDEVLEPGEVGFDPLRRSVLGRGDVYLAAHEGTVWQVSARGITPRVVGDTGHVAFARLFERRVSGSVIVRNDSPWPRTIVVESRGQLRLAELPPRRRQTFQ